jgi:hypothetical protein
VAPRTVGTTSIRPRDRTQFAWRPIDDERSPSAVRTSGRARSRSVRTACGLPCRTAIARRLRASSVAVPGTSSTAAAKRDICEESPIATRSARAPAFMRANNCAPPSKCSSTLAPGWSAS